MMKRLFIFAALAFGMLTVVNAQQTVLASTADFPQAKFGQTVYQNPLLSRTQAHASNIEVRMPSANVGAATMSGTVFSNDLFNRKNRRNTATNFAYRGFTEISAYQSVSPSDIGASGANAPRKGFGPPPPTPDPDNPHILPVGDAWWLLMLLAIGYGAFILIRRRKNA